MAIWAICVCANVYIVYMYVYMHMSMYPCPPVDVVGGGRIRGVGGWGVGGGGGGGWGSNPPYYMGGGRKHETRDHTYTHRYIYIYCNIHRGCIESMIFWQNPMIDAQHCHKYPHFWSSPTCRWSGRCCCCLVRCGHWSSACDITRCPSHIWATSHVRSCCWFLNQVKR